MCDLFEVSRAGFYAWLNRPESPRKRENKRLGALVKESFALSRGTYGYRRVYKDLQEQQETCSEYLVTQLMKQQGLRAKARRKFKVTTDSKHSTNRIYYHD